MAIYDRQYKEILTRELLKILVRGRLPNIREISKHLSKAAEKKGTLYQFIPQARKEVFNNKLFNKQLNSIEFDVHILHQELLHQIEEAGRRLSYADLFHKVHSYELQKLGSALNAILFTFENADFFFLGAFDSFTDYSKTNLDASDPDVINLAEKALALPYGGKNTQRVHTNHLYGHETWPVNVLSPPPSAILAKGQVDSTSFGSIFSDQVNGWMYSMLLNDQGPASIQFKFSLAGLARKEVEVQVNRFEITPFSTTGQRAKIEFSTDDVNWKTPEGFETGVMMEDQKLTYGMDFITELAQFIRITLTKTNFDDEVSTGANNKQYVYRFGLKGFAAYTVGRKQKARYQSKVFDFSQEEEDISRVSLKADTLVPRGTAIDFSVALALPDGTPTSSFLPIKPIGGDAKAGASEVVKFGTTESQEKRFEARTGEFSQREIFRGHKFFKYIRPVLPSAIFGTATLLRGHKVWSRDTDVALTRTEVSDNYLSFAKVDIEHLFAVVSEVPVQRHFTASGKATVELTLTKPVYYTRGIHDLIPNFGQGSTNMTPTYGVYQIEHIVDKPKQTHSVATAKRTVITLPVSNFVLTGANAPKVKVGAQTYLAGRDYVIETTTVGGIARPTGNLSIVPAAQGGTIYPASGAIDVILKITLLADADVTYKVTDIQANKVTMSNMKADRKDSFKITYRFTPVVPNSIEKASVRVKNGLSSRSGSKFFVEGVDFVLDIDNGAIQRLPNGAIPDKGSVFVDFLYRNAETSVETFLTWCYVKEDLGSRIRFDLDPTIKKNALVADEKVGEQFLVNTQGGLIDLTRAEVSPLIGPGWVQFIVRSKNPDANKGGRDNLIDQVVQLRDVNKRRVFKEGGSYFTDILAFRDPMTQVTLNQLRVNTLPSDHSVFAIDETKLTEPLVVINFKPGETTELYLKIPQDESSNTLAPVSYFEVFTLRWETKVNTQAKGSAVLVRCDLSREPDIDGGITPKVFDYFLRASEL